MTRQSKFRIQNLDLPESIRLRLAPQRSDETYLHLSDLLDVLQQALSGCNGKLLDFGCGGSPYLNIFNGSIYHRADVSLDLENIDFLIGSDGRIDVASSFYDVVLSTQVLEHVSDPHIYLEESYRVLKPGGKILISTHGSFVDHGCPYDFRRWTVDGLKLDLQSSGFQIEEVYKLTLGLRAVFFLAENYFGSLWGSRRTCQGLALWLFQKFFWTNRVGRHRWIDHNWPMLRVQAASNPEPLYICIFAVASKP